MADASVVTDAFSSQIRSREKSKRIADRSYKVMELLLKGVICRQLSLLLVFTGAGFLTRFIVER